MWGSTKANVVFEQLVLQPRLFRLGCTYTHFLLVQLLPLWTWGAPSSYCNMNFPHFVYEIQGFEVHRREAVIHLEQLSTNPASSIQSSFTTMLDATLPVTPPKTAIRFSLASVAMPGGQHGFKPSRLFPSHRSHSVAGMPIHVAGLWHHERTAFDHIADVACVCVNLAPQNTKGTTKWESHPACEGVGPSAARYRRVRSRARHSVSPTARVAWARTTEGPVVC